jgi:hypothetical protein
LSSAETEMPSLLLTAAVCTKNGYQEAGTSSHIFKAL